MDYTESQILNFSNQLVYKILNSKINNYPFFHCETKNILPKELFDLTIINFPKQDEFISHTEFRCSYNKIRKIQFLISPIRF